MMDEGSPSQSRPVTYQLIIAGYLDPSWSDWFDGMVIAQMPNGTTSMTGAVADQAALYGLLARACDLGLTLLGLQRADAPLPDTRSAGGSEQ
jgi:hypothetical protein